MASAAVDASAAGDAVTCSRCGAVVARSRFVAHDTHWCEALDGDSDDATAAPSAPPQPPVSNALPPATLPPATLPPAAHRLPTADVLASVASQLLSRRYAVVDGFLDDPTPLYSLLHEMRRAGALKAGDVAGGRAAATYARITGQPLPRGDLMTWLGADEAARPELTPLLTSLDWLAARLQEELPAELAGPPLERDEMQATCYPGDGARYVRHVDNNDPPVATGGGGVVRRGRRLTCIFYANADWAVADGGQLRLYLPPALCPGSPPAGAGEEEACVDVQPLGNRLVAFWSDGRVPHEVMPARAERFAVSAWYSQRAS